MTTIKRFIWFTTHSWSYMQGDRRHMVTHFWGAWQHFNANCKQDEQEAK